MGMLSKKESKVNNKIKAAAITAGLIAGTIGVVALVSAGVNHLTTEQITTFVGSVCIGAIVYSIYQLILSRLEYQDTLKKIQDSQG